MNNLTRRIREERDLYSFRRKATKEQIRKARKEWERAIKQLEQEERNGI